MFTWQNLMTYFLECILIVKKCTSVLNIRSHTQKAMYCVLLFIWPPEEGKSRHKSYISSCYELGEMKMIDYKEVLGNLGGDRNILILVVVVFVKFHRLKHEEKGSFTTCKLYHNKSDLEGQKEKKEKQRQRYQVWPSNV